MALLTSHSSANLVIDSGLVVSYSKTRISGNWANASGNVSSYYEYMMEYHRRARMSFRYVGMTESAAKSCKTAMISAYTRAYKESQWDDSSISGSWSDANAGETPMAEISMSHNEDGSYDVVVNVNEDDVRMRKTTDYASYTALFSTERSRTYANGETETSST